MKQIRIKKPTTLDIYKMAIVSAGIAFLITILNILGILPLTK